MRIRQRVVKYGLPLRHVMINITGGVLLFFISFTTAIFISYLFLVLVLPSVFLFWRAYRWNKGGKSLNRIKFCDQFLKIIEPQDKDKILDVGTGGGLLAIESAKKINSTEIYGIDIWRRFYSGTNMETARMNAEISGVGGKVQFKYGNALDIPFPDNFFDIVTASFVVHNIKKSRMKGLEEMIRVLKNGGKFAVLEPKKDVSLNWEVNENLKNSLSNLGLQDIHFTPIPVSFPKKRNAIAVSGVKKLKPQKEKPI